MISLLLRFVGYGWAFVGICAFIFSISTAINYQTILPIAPILGASMLKMILPGLIVGGLGSILKTLQDIHKAEVYIEP